MQFKTESKRLGSHIYTVTQLNAVTGRRALLRLSKILGPAFTEGLRGGQAASYSAIASNLTENDLDYFCDLLSAQTSVRGGEYAEAAEPQLDKVFAEHFADNYFELLEWLSFALEVNFSSFFRGLATKLSAAIKQAKESATSSTSPSTSTGSTGD